MITPILSGIFGFVLFYFVTSYYEELSFYLSVRIIASFFLSLVFFALGIVGSLLLGTVYTTSDDFYHRKYEKELVSLNGNTGVEGEFFLGTGNVRGKYRFHYRVNTSKGIETRSSSQGSSYVLEMVNKDPKVVYHKYYRKTIWKFYLPIRFFAERGVIDYQQFYIPEGTVDKDYKVK